MFKKILIANDGSEGAFKALTAALEIAYSQAAQVHMICVDEPRLAAADSGSKFAEVVSKAQTQAKRHGVVLTTHLMAGRPVTVILDLVAREAFDLLVTGFMGHSALYHRMFGMSTERFVEFAPCSVLVVK